jgi:zinc protease
VGDVSADEVFALAKKYLEPIPRQDPPPPVRTTEPEQLGEKRVRVERDASTPLLYVAYKSPAANDSQGPAINLLMTILAEGDASRLHRLLVEEKKLAIDVSGTFSEGFDPGLTWLMLTLPEGGDPAKVLEVLDGALAQAVAQGVTEAELVRAKNLYASAFWKSLATIDGKASLLGHFEVYEGDYQKLFNSPALYEKVTREEVQKAAALIFQERQRTVGVLQSPPAVPEAKP